MSISSDGK